MAPILPDLDPGTIYLVDHDGTAWRATPVTLAASVDFVRLGGRCAVERDRDIERATDSGESVQPERVRLALTSRHVSGSTRSGCGTPTRPTPSTARGNEHE